MTETDEPPAYRVNDAKRRCWDNPWIDTPMLAPGFFSRFPLSMRELLTPLITRLRQELRPWLKFLTSDDKQWLKQKLVEIIEAVFAEE